MEQKDLGWTGPASEASAVPPPPDSPLPPPPATCSGCGGFLAAGAAFCSVCGTEAGAAAKGGKRSRGVILAIAAVAAVVLVGAAAVGLLALTTTSTRTVEGSATLVDSDFSRQSVGASCSGSGGYSDLRAGASMRLADGEGATIATTNLAPGVVPRSGRCLFSFTFDEIPDVDFYAVTIGGGRRGELSYSREELEAKNWEIDLSIGD
jgi:hypothetical protein